MYSSTRCDTCMSASKGDTSAITVFNNIGTFRTVCANCAQHKCALRAIYSNALGDWRCSAMTNTYRMKLSKNELNFLSNLVSTVNEATVRIFEIASDAI